MYRLAGSIFISLALLVSCGPQYPVDEHNMLGTLHSYFNEEELTLHENVMLKSNMRAVMVGHIHDLLKHPATFDIVIEEINFQRPDYVFFLGDMVYDNTEEEWALLEEKLSKIRGNHFFIPGNHDVNFHEERFHGRTGDQWEAETRYLQHVDYRYKVIRDNFANYILLNTNDSIGRIEAYLDTMSKHIDPDEPTLVLSHHNIWKANKSNQNPETWTEKSMTRNEILKPLKDYRYLVHGCCDDRFNQVPHRFEDQIFQAVTVGIGDEGSHLYITVAQITYDSVFFRPKFIELDPSDSWYTGSQN